MTSLTLLAQPLTVLGSVKHWSTEASDRSVSLLEFWELGNSLTDGAGVLIQDFGDTAAL